MGKGFVVNSSIFGSDDSIASPPYSKDITKPVTQYSFWDTDLIAGKTATAILLGKNADGTTGFDPNLHIFSLNTLPYPLVAEDDDTFGNTNSKATFLVNAGEQYSAAIESWNVFPDADSKPFYLEIQVDDAGNTQGDARNIGALTGNQTFADFVGVSDTDDYYKFTVATPSNFSLTLTGLSHDVDVRLLNNSGGLIPPAGTNNGTANELITHTLDPGTYYVRINAPFAAQTDRAIKSGDVASNYTLNLSAVAINQAPTDITLSNSSVNEHQSANTVVGTLATADPDAGDTHTYSLVAGDGDIGNAAFTIDGNTLKTARALDFETQNSYNIRVRTTDSVGHAFDKKLTVSVADVLIPFGVAPSPPAGGQKGVIRRGSNDDDELRGTGRNDILNGKGGDDEIIAHIGHDRLNGGSGDDDLRGDAGSDILKGNSGEDVLTGGAGVDSLTGGPGSDVLNGGAGVDLFTFNSRTDAGLSPEGDTITGFSVINDLIDLRSLLARPEYGTGSAEVKYEQFLRTEQIGVNVAIKVDTDGLGLGTTFQTLATLQNIALPTLQTTNFLIA